MPDGIWATTINVNINKYIYIYFSRNLSGPYLRRGHIGAVLREPFTGTTLQVQPATLDNPSR